MQVELLEAKTDDLRPFGAAEVAAMRAATSPGTGLAYGLRRVCAAWGMARSSFYAMTEMRPARQAAAGKASGTEARDLGPGAAGGDRNLEASPWEGEPTARSGLGFGSVANPGCPQPGLIASQSALAPSLPPPWRQSP